MHDHAIAEHAVLRHDSVSHDLAIGAEMRKKMNAENVSDEEFLLRWNLDVEEIAAMRAAGAPKEYLTARQPLVNLLDALTKRNDYRQIVIQKGDMKVSLNRSAPTA